MKRDHTETAARNFHSPRSFVSLPQAILACPNAQHDKLYGELDKAARRMEIYTRSHGRCELTLSPRCRGFASWDDGEWCHKAKHPADRCDCAEGAHWGCKPCHRFEHRNRNPKWSKNATK